MIRTPNLLIWSQTRYHCATESTHYGRHMTVLDITSTATNISDSRQESCNITFKYCSRPAGFIGGPRGLMDKASDFGSEDCRFESCRGRKRIFFISFNFVPDGRNRKDIKRKSCAQSEWKISSPVGFEPTTSGLEVRRANPLRYGDLAVSELPIYIYQNEVNT